jgi:DNA mismatch repair protein MutS2
MCKGENKVYSIGEYVKVKNHNIEGKIVNIVKNIVSIKANEKIVKVNVSDIEKTKEPENKNNGFSVNVKISTPPEYEIMIRHQTVEEALANLDKFIDNAICNNVKIVKIIHGKQGGKLRHAVHDYLENSPYVKEHRLGGYYEGSYGVTIAFLK